MINNLKHIGYWAFLFSVISIGCFNKENNSRKNIYEKYIDVDATTGATALSMIGKYKGVVLDSLIDIQAQDSIIQTIIKENKGATLQNFKFGVKSIGKDSVSVDFIEIKDNQVFIFKSFTIDTLNLLSKSMQNITLENKEQNPNK